MSGDALELRPIGRVESPLTDPADAPKQGHEGAPDAWLALELDMLPGLEDVRPGDGLLVLTWLGRARRDILRVHPRDDATAPMRGVFGTRSADRPNPIGLHDVEVLSVEGAKLHVRPLEAVDGTPVLDIKPVLGGPPSGEPREPPSNPAVSLAGVGDAEVAGRLLHDFNTEFDDPSPGPAILAERLRGLIAAGHVTVLLPAGEPHGIAVLRFRPALWTDGLDCYLEELYVVPDRRGRGLGRAIMEAAIEVARRRGATRMDLGTGEDDAAARALYESLGFSDREGEPDGAVNLFYERDL